MPSDRKAKGEWGEAKWEKHGPVSEKGSPNILLDDTQAWKQCEAPTLQITRQPMIKKGYKGCPRPGLQLRKPVYISLEFPEQAESDRQSFYQVGL